MHLAYMLGSKPGLSPIAGLHRIRPHLPIHQKYKGPQSTKSNAMPSSKGNVTGSNYSTLPGVNSWQFGTCLWLQAFLCINSFCNLHWLTGCVRCSVSFATVRACVGLMLATSFKKVLARCQVCFPKSVSSGMLPSTSYVWTLEASISHPCYLKKLEVISRNLMQHLRGQQRPTLTHVNVGGVLLRLPIRADALVGKRVSIAKADAVYLAGFFDGDGCVAPEMNLSGFQLRVGQQIGSSSILIAFLYRFGGAISASHSGTGTKQPSIQWLVSGQSARNAAAELHKHCLVKKEQLEIALHWPEQEGKRAGCCKTEGDEKVGTKHYEKCRELVGLYQWFFRRRRVHQDFG